MMNIIHDIRLNKTALVFELHKCRVEAKHHLIYAGLTLQNNGIISCI